MLLLQLDGHQTLKLSTSKLLFLSPLPVNWNVLLFTLTIVVSFLGAKTETVVVEAVTEAAVAKVVTTIATET